MLAALLLVQNLASPLCWMGEKVAMLFLFCECFRYKRVRSESDRSKINQAEYLIWTQQLRTGCTSMKYLISAKPFAKFYRES